MNEADKPKRARKQKPIRFKIIRPVYETLTVSDQAAQYQDTHLSSSREVVKLFDCLARETKEHFWAVHLDSKNKMLCLDQVSTGSLNASIVHPREVFKSVLLSSAVALLLLHNHPSGDPTPSREVIELTTRFGISSVHKESHYDQQENHYKIVNLSHYGRVIPLYC